AAILDLTELAPDAPEVTELIAAVSAGQSQTGRAAAQREATPVFIDEPAVASAAAEIAATEIPLTVEAAAPVEIPAAPAQVREPRIAPPPAPAASAPAPGLDKPAAKEPAEDLLEIAAPPKSPPAMAPTASAGSQSTEDILGDFVLDLEQSEELQDFVPRQPAPAPVSAPEPAPVFAQAAAAAPALQHRNGDMQDTESANV